MYLEGYGRVLAGIHESKPLCRLCAAAAAACLAALAGFVQAQAEAVASSINQALTCGCQAGQATAQALAQAVAEAGGCDCVPNLAQALAGKQRASYTSHLDNCRGALL